MENVAIKIVQKGEAEMIWKIKKNNKDMDYIIRHGSLGH